MGYTPNNPNGQATSANSAPVVLSSQQQAILEATNTALGTPSDVAASSDTGTFSIISFIKRAIQNWTTLLSRIPTLGTKIASASLPVIQSIESASASTIVELYLIHYFVFKTNPLLDSRAERIFLCVYFFDLHLMSIRLELVSRIVFYQKTYV